MNTPNTKLMAYLFLCFLCGLFVGTLQTYAALHFTDINKWFTPTSQVLKSPVPTITPKPTIAPTTTPSPTLTPTVFIPYHYRRTATPSAILKP